MGSESNLQVVHINANFRRHVILLQPHCSWGLLSIDESKIVAKKAVCSPSSMFNHPNHHKLLRQLAATATLKLRTTSGTISTKISGKRLVFLTLKTAFCNQNLFLV